MRSFLTPRNGFYKGTRLHVSYRNFGAITLVRLFISPRPPSTPTAIESTLHRRATIRHQGPGSRCRHMLRCRRGNIHIFQRLPPHASNSTYFPPTPDFERYVSSARHTTPWTGARNESYKKMQILRILGDSSLEPLAWQTLNIVHKRRDQRPTKNRHNNVLLVHACPARLPKDGWRQKSRRCNSTWPTFSILRRAVESATLAESTFPPSPLGASRVYLVGENSM